MNADGGVIEKAGWFLHNTVGHPIMGILCALGRGKMGRSVHDWTLPTGAGEGVTIQTPRGAFTLRKGPPMVFGTSGDMATGDFEALRTEVIRSEMSASDAVIVLAIGREQ